MQTMLQKKIEKYKPDVLVIEDVVLQRSPATMKMLAQLQGFLIGCCRSQGIQYQIIYPSSWRKALGFKQGGAKRPELKKMAIDYVLKTYNISAGEDEADAICIGAAYINTLKD